MIGPRSLGIIAWAGALHVEKSWQDSETIGWVRADGDRAIETGGGVYTEHNDALEFEAAWAARGHDVVLGEDI